MILGGKAIQSAFTSRWSAFRNGKQMTKDQMFDAIGPNSFDVTLGQRIMEQHPVTLIDPHKNVSNYNVGIIPMVGRILEPGDFLLGVTQERFVTDSPIEIQTGPEEEISESLSRTPRNPTYFVQKYDGRSTVGRLGVASHVTAGFGDYGFSDYWTLEIVNLGNVPVILYAGMRIGQISFEAVYEPSEYKGAYTEVSDLPTPKPPKLGKDRF